MLVDASLGRRPASNDGGSARFSSSTSPRLRNAAALGWLEKQAAETVLARLHEHIAGLQADADVQQWQAQAIAEIASRVGETE